MERARRHHAVARWLERVVIEPDKEGVCGSCFVRWAIRELASQRTNASPLLLSTRGHG